MELWRWEAEELLKCYVWFVCTITCLKRIEIALGIVPHVTASCKHWCSSSNDKLNSCLGFLKPALLLTKSSSSTWLAPGCHRLGKTSPISTHIFSYQLLLPAALLMLWTFAVLLHLELLPTNSEMRKWKTQLPTTQVKLSWSCSWLFGRLNSGDSLGVDWFICSPTQHHRASKWWWRCGP